MATKSNEEDPLGSVDRVRAVGQTFADSVSALRDRIVTATGVKDMPSGDVSTSVGSGMVEPTTITSSADGNSPEDNNNGQIQLERDVEQLQNELLAMERQLEAVRREADMLRSTESVANARHERQTRALETVRRQVDKSAERAVEAEDRASRAEAEVARLRAEATEVNREMERREQEAEAAERRAIDETARRTALERVVMGLRRRVALAEDAAAKTQDLHEALAARHSAESALVDARTEAERWRARCASVDALRERADAAERSERALRERVSALESEVNSRDTLLRQTRAERQKLAQMMTYYERDLARKDTKISALKRSLRKLRARYEDDDVDLDSIENDSVPSISWDRDGAVSEVGDITETPSSTDHYHDIYLSDGLQPQTNARNEEFIRPIKSRNRRHSEEEEHDQMEFGTRFKEKQHSSVREVEARRQKVLDASPLLREVEEAHAQLQAAFEETAESESLADVNVDLVERVKRLEATFGELTKR